MMSPAQAQQHLLRTLHSHSTALKEEDIQWAFEAKATQKVVVDWVQEFLGPETLLSQEEAELYSKLEENGIVNRIIAKHDLSTVRPFFDDQIRTAVKCLKDSTSAIEKHNQVLRQQQQALSSFQENNGQARERWRRIAGQRQKKRTQEKQNMELAVEELLQTMISSTDAAQRHLQSASSVFPSTVAESLQKDDRVLARIDRLAGELEASDVDDGQQITRSRNLCEKLGTYLADETRCRLDRIYLETSQSHTKPSKKCSQDQVELESSLKAELDSLYSEISAVAQMSASLEFETPLIEATQQEMVQHNENIGSVLDHINDSMTYLLEKMDHVRMHAQIHASHRAALDALRGELHGLQISTRQTRTSADDGVGNPPRRLTTPHNIEAECKGASLEAPSNDHRRLLCVLGIPSLEDLGTEDIEDMLDIEASDKERLTSDSSLGVERSLDRTLTSYLNDLFCTQQILVDALLIDTAYHTVDMFDPGLRSEISTLETDIGNVGSDMADLDLEKLKMASKERDRFVNQWAH